MPSVAVCVELPQFVAEHAQVVRGIADGVSRHRGAQARIESIQLDDGALDAPQRVAPPSKKERLVVAEFVYGHSSVGRAGPVAGGDDAVAVFPEMRDEGLGRGEEFDGFGDQGQLALGDVSG